MFDKASNDFRSLTRQNFFWIRTKITLFLSIRISLVLQVAPSSPASSHLYQKILLNHQSFHQLVLDSRSVHLIYSELHCFSITSFTHFFYVIQQQLQSLLETLSATEPHYVRCIKPNNLLKPSIFENGNVLQQLRCGVRDILLYFLFFVW